MIEDMREDPDFLKAKQYFETVHRPDSGLVSDAAELDISPDGCSAIYSGTMVSQEEFGSKIMLTDLSSGQTRFLTLGRGKDKAPKYSPCGRRIAFLSDRNRAGDFQLYFYDIETGEVTAAPQVEGWVEYFNWSPSGSRVLLGVAGHGADVAGGQGAIASSRLRGDRPSWMPTVDSGQETFRWRRVWIFDNETQELSPASPFQLNIWEAAWCGETSIVAIASKRPDEGAWYTASIVVFYPGQTDSKEIYRPIDQVGYVGSSPNGQRVSFVEAICSDRGIIAGALKIVDLKSTEITTVDADGVDVSAARWSSETSLLATGHRRFETVIAQVRAEDWSWNPTWSDATLTGAGRYADAVPIGREGDCVLIAESFADAPTISVIVGGKVRTVKSFDLGYGQQFPPQALTRRVTWKSPDGVEIDGWVLVPEGQGPFPTVMSVHGGPVWQFRATSLDRGNSVYMLLLQKGFAVFFPNPRGSTGKGRAFIEPLLGDLGGCDAQDCLSGLDELVAIGISDADRLAVTGRSYGGYMTAWLITQDTRFAAAVPVAPFTNPVTEQLVSNIPFFVGHFFADTYENLRGTYYSRSPVMFASKVKTPTLHICGALDRCTPPEEAAQFHNALLQRGGNSVLVTYPTEGHGVQAWTASIDFTARMLKWFREYV